MGDFDNAVQLFARLPISARTSALHEAVILACAHVPDASAAAVVLKGMPRPTMAAYSHVVTAHCREHDPAAAISLLEAMPKSADLRLDMRLLETVARHIRNRANDCRTNHAPLLERLNRLVSSCDPSPHASDGRASASLSTFDFFKDDGGDVGAWLALRNESIHSPDKSVRSRLPHGCRPHAVPDCQGLSVILKGADRSSQQEGLNGLSGSNANIERFNVDSNYEVKSSKRRAVEADLRSARGNYRKIERTKKLVCADPRLRHDVSMVSALLFAYMSCGRMGMSEALNFLCSLFDGTVSSNERLRHDLQRSPTSRSNLLTTATSVIAGSAPEAPLQALDAYRSLVALNVQGYKSSLPLSGALLKVLRHARLPVAETLSYIKQLRNGLIQLDEQSFSLALSAILNSAGSESGIWTEARNWLSAMQAAGIPLTIHTYNAFAYHLRDFNNPEMATSLLRDLALTDVKPTAHTYGLIFESCIGRRRYANTWSGSDYSTKRRLRVLTAIDGHMAESGVGHSRVSRFALARAYAHLGQVSSAFGNFDALWACESEPNELAGILHRTGMRAAGLDQNFLDSSDPVRNQHVYNLMLRSFAHSRCISTDAPTAVLSTYRRMTDANVPPNAETLEHLLSACIRIGQSARAIKYVKEFVYLLGDDKTEFALRPRGILNLFAILANVTTRDAWDACEVILERSLSLDGRRIRWKVGC
jgi:hypothetical protein